MKNGKAARIIVAVFIIISIVSVLSVALQRMQIEKESNQAEIIVDYTQFKLMAEDSEHELLWWLKNLKDFGATSVAISEMTLWDYINEHDISHNVLGEIKKDSGWENDYPASIRDKIASSDDYDLLLFINHKEQYAFISSLLKKYNSIQWYEATSGTSHYIIIDQSKKDLIYSTLLTNYNKQQKKNGSFTEVVGTDVLNIVVGYDPEIINYIQQSGLSLVLRPINNNKYFKESVDVYLEELQKYQNINPLLLFSGSQVLGYNEDDFDTSAIQNLIESKGMVMALIEPDSQRLYIEQDGTEELLEVITEDKMVRAFTLWPYLQARYKYFYYEGAEEITNTLYRAITERNIKVVYLTPIKEDASTYLTEIDEYSKMFQDLKRRLAEHGYTLGNFKAFRDYSLSMWMKVLLSTEVMFFALLLFNMGIYRLKPLWNAVFGILLALGVIAAYFVAPNFSVKLFTLGAAIIFSSLSVTVFIKQYLNKHKPLPKRNLLIYSIGSLILMVAISLLGALYIGTIMADTKFLLEIDAFTGVKASTILPIAVVAFIAMIRSMRFTAPYSLKELLKSVVDKLKQLINITIKVKHLLLVAVVGLIGYIYIARTGHASSIINPGWEIMGRNFLENVLLARPRTKEFAISFPLAIVAVYAYGYFRSHKIKINDMIFVLIAAIVAIVGQSSITNTFSHIRTPLYMSLYRTLYSTLIGTVIGVIYIAIFAAIMKLFKKKSTNVTGRS